MLGFPFETLGTPEFFPSTFDLPSYSSFLAYDETLLTCTDIEERRHLLELSLVAQRIDILLSQLARRIYLQTITSNHNDHLLLKILQDTFRNQLDYLYSRLQSEYAQLRKVHLYFTKTKVHSELCEKIASILCTPLD